MEAAAFVKEFGLPLVIIVGASWFFVREVWPFIKGRVEAAHADRIEQQKEFFSTLKQFAELVTTQRQSTLSALAQLTGRMEETADTLTSVVRLIEQLHKASTEREHGRDRK